MKDDKFYVIHVLEEIARLEKFAAEGKEAFLSSDLIRYAVLRSLQTLGESIKRLSERVKAAYPEVDWRGIVALRNLLVHDYLDIDPEEIWNIVALDAPVLKGQMQKVLRELVS
ncbi:MAG: HepT-like ribonuclease domain-containing protein [Desulfobaccales bacterium]